MAGKVKKFSRDLNFLYIVDNKKLFHHISLFHLNASKKNLPRIIIESDKLLKELRGIKILSKKIIADGTSPTLEFSRPTKLVQVKDEVIKTLAPLRQDVMPYISKKSPSPLRQRYRRQFGVHYNIGRYFRPHITLAKLKNKSDSRMIAKRLGAFKFNFVITNVAVAQVNNYGQVTRIIKKFRI